MSSVRDYFKEKEKRQSTTRNIDYKEKIRSHKLTFFYRTVLCILLLTVVIAFLIMQWKNKVFTESVVASSHSVTIVQGANVKNLDGSILLYKEYYI